MKRIAIPVAVVFSLTGCSLFPGTLAHKIKGLNHQAPPFYESAMYNIDINALDTASSVESPAS